MERRDFPGYSGTMEDGTYRWTCEVRWRIVPEHNWSGWPGAWCLDCGCDDPREIALADGSWDEDADGNPIVRVTAEQMECKEPGSGRFDPYRARQDQQRGKDD